jgi:hypothetical protein
MVLGPPYGGKSTVAKIISEKYNISHLTIDKICEWIKNEKRPLGDEVRQKAEEIEENMTKAMDEYEHRKNKKKTDPPFDPNQYRRYSNDLLGKIIKNKLNEGECLGKGYILENYPKNYEDCINIFSDTPYDKEKKEGEEIVYEINKDLLPNSVIIINNYKEESLKNKLKLKYPDYPERQNELDFKYNKRLTNYKHFEEINDDNKKLVEDFFKENGVEIFYIDEGISLENNNEENQKIFDYLERNGPIDNEYKLFDEEEIKIFENLNNLINKEEKKDEINESKNENDENKNISENNIKEDKDNIKPKKDENANDEEEKIESKEKTESKKEENKTKSNINENEGENNDEEKKMSNIEMSKAEMNENEKIQQKLNEIREREISLLEKKSEILRRYLSENVMPLLAKGVLYVCQNMPDDPVEALANYLLDNSLNISKVKDNHNKTESELEKIIDETLV